MKTHSENLEAPKEIEKNGKKKKLKINFKFC